jgi:hypothetical protein
MEPSSNAGPEHNLIGQEVHCRVVGPRPDGYSVSLVKSGQNGYLQVSARLRPGDELIAKITGWNQEQSELVLVPELATPPEDWRWIAQA